MSDRTAIIIGAGLGGLLTGAFLAKEGVKVTIIEKVHQVGGGLQSYVRKGVVFDTGMHLFGGMNANGNIHRICDYLGITNDFDTLPLNPEHNCTVYVASDHKTYDISLDHKHFAESLSRYFPAEKENLAKYADEIVKIMEKFDLFHLRRAAESAPNENFMLSADEFISKYISDDRLRSLLAVVNVLYAGERGVSPAYLHSAISMTFLNGACRVTDGYSTFANALVNMIERNGGKIFTDDGAKEIVSLGKRVTGVVTESGKSYAADWIVSSITPSTMVKMLDNPSLLSNAYRITVAEKKDSLSAFIINIKLKENALRFFNHIGFYLNDYESVWRVSDGTSVEKLMFMTPPVSNQREYAASLNILVPMSWVAVKAWEGTTIGNRPKEYVAFKQEFYEKVLDKMAMIIPNIREMIDYVDLSTPLTIRDYTGIGHGAMCGFRKDCHDILPFLPVVTKVPNLFLTGQSVNLHGFCGVSLTAIQSAQAILGKDYIINKINQES